jgi:hypothetical protein
MVGTCYVGQLEELVICNVEQKAEAEAVVIASYVRDTRMLLRIKGLSLWYSSSILCSCSSHLLYSSPTSDSHALSTS